MATSSPERAENATECAKLAEQVKRFFEEFLECKFIQGLPSEEQDSSPTVYQHGSFLGLSEEAAQRFFMAMKESYEFEGVDFGSFIPMPPTRITPTTETLWDSEFITQKCYEMWPTTAPKTTNQGVRGTHNTTMTSAAELFPDVPQDHLSNWDSVANPELNQKLEQARRKCLEISRRPGSGVLMIEHDMYSWPLVRKHRKTHRLFPDIPENLPLAKPLSPDEVISLVSKEYMKVRSHRFTKDFVLIKIVFQRNPTRTTCHANSLLISLREGIAYLFEPNRSKFGWMSLLPMVAPYVCVGLNIRCLYRIFGTQTKNKTCRLHSVLFDMDVVRGKVPDLEQEHQRFILPVVPARKPLFILTPHSVLDHKIKLREEDTAADRSMDLALVEPSGSTFQDLHPFMGTLKETEDTS